MKVFFSPSLWFKKERKKKVSYFFQLLLTSFPGWKNPIRVTVVSCVQFLFNQSFSCNFAKARILFFFLFWGEKKSRILQPTRESQRKIFFFFLNYKKKILFCGAYGVACFAVLFLDFCCFAQRRSIRTAFRLFFLFFFRFFFRGRKRGSVKRLWKKNKWHATLKTFFFWKIERAKEKKKEAEKKN